MRPIDAPDATTDEALAGAAPRPPQDPLDRTDPPDPGLAAELVGLLATLHMLAGEDPDELRSCERLLVRTFGETLADLDAALAADDRARLGFHAHSLKGSALSSGLEHTAALAEALEHAARAADPPTLAADLTRLRARLARVLQAITPP